MRRCLFTLISAVSLVVFVMVVVLWVRSYWVADSVQWVTRKGTEPGDIEDERRLLSGRGLVSAIWGRITFVPPGWTPGASIGPGTGVPDTPPVSGPSGRVEYRRTRPSAILFLDGGGPLGRLGFKLWVPAESMRQAGYWTWGIRVPHWFLSLATGMLPVLWVLRRRVRSRRSGLRLCLNCGYDLRTSKDRCPECGTAIEQTVRVG